MAKKSKSQSSRGGPRPGAGRKKGSANIASFADKKALAEYARKYAEDCIEGLIDIATSSESDAARVTAYNAVLDRAYGKPAQDIDIGNQDGEEFIVNGSAQKVIDILDEIAKQKAASK